MISFTCFLSPRCTEHTLYRVFSPYHITSPPSTHLTHSCTQFTHLPHPTLSFHPLPSIHCPMFSCYLSTTLTQLLCDIIKHEVAYFPAFLVPFRLVLRNLCFEDTKIFDILYIRKHVIEGCKRNMKPSKKFLLNVTDYAWY